jgi:VanZ family protein
VSSERRLQWWWAALALGVAAFAIYISLVPFNFVRPHAGLTMTGLLERTLDRRVGSHTNLLANVVMFVPLGFFGLGVFVHEQSRAWQWLIAAAGVLAASLTLSFTIEAAQVLVPGRTPSLFDIVAQTLGACIGMVGWAALAKEVRTFSLRFAAGSRRALETALAGYAVVHMYLLLQPLDVTVELTDIWRRIRAGRVVLNPLRSPTLTWDLLPAMLADFALAAPIGVLAAIAGRPAGTRRGMLPAVALGWSFFACGEIAQIFVRSRTADIVDLLANGLGVLAGVALVSAVTPGPIESERRQPGTWRLRTGLIVATLIYAAYNLSPFDFTYAGQATIRRFNVLLNPPFLGYYINQEFKALADIAIKVSLSVPFGLFFQRLFRPDLSAYRRTVTIAWFGSMAAFFTAVEVGQVFVPSRYPDNTDVLLALTGIWVGIRLARPFTSPATADQGPDPPPPVPSEVSGR